jgi:hypothetical protein
MRPAFVLCLFLTAASLTAAVQKEKPSTGPKKGDAIAVRGCLTGTALEATDLRSVDVTSALASGVTFRLTGDKNLLKRLRDEHDGKVVDVEGLLKSDLPNENVQTRKVGKMRITIGSPAANPASPAAEAQRSLPVLEVKSYDGSATSCRR